MRDNSASTMYGLIFDNTESSAVDTSELLASFVLAFGRSLLVRLMDLLR